MDKDSAKHSDDEIICRVIEGDVNAFEHLMTRYKRYVFKIVNKHIPHDQVEEIAQDVFIRAYQSLSSFKGKSSFKQWLAKITVRTCYDFWRKSYRNREFPMSSLSENQQNWLESVMSDQSESSFYEQGKQAAAKEVLDYALDSLSAEDRMILELVYLEGHTVKEAASLLGWSLANAKIRAFRSRKKLHKLLTGLVTES